MFVAEEPLVSKESSASGEPLVSDESSASEEPLASDESSTSEEPLASDESSTSEEPLASDEPFTTEEQPNPEEGGTIVFKDTDVSEDLFVSSEEPPSSLQPEPSDWFVNGEAVRQFVEEHHREPLELFTKEHQLALWLQQQKENWHKGLLSPDEEQCLLAIRDMLW